VPRPKSDKTYLRELLDADAALPAEQRMSTTKRAEITLTLVECTRAASRKGKGANKTKIRKVPARTARSVSPEFEASIKLKPSAPVKPEKTFADAMKELDESGT